MNIKKMILLNYTKNIGRATLVSIGLTLIALLIQTVTMFYTDVSETILPITSSIIMTLSVAAGSIYASLKIRQKGWMNGAIIGILYIIMIIILSMIFLDGFVLNSYVFLKTIIALVTGMISGMIGVNLK